MNAHQVYKWVDYISCFCVGIFNKCKGQVKYSSTKTMNKLSTNILLFLLHNTHMLVIKERGHINTSQI